MCNILPEYPKTLSWEQKEKVVEGTWKLGLTWKDSCLSGPSSSDRNDFYFPKPVDFKLSLGEWKKEPKETFFFKESSFRSSSILIATGTEVAAIICHLSASFEKVRLFCDYLFSIESYFFMQSKEEGGLPVYYFPVLSTEAHTEKKKPLIN